MQQIREVAKKSPQNILNFGNTGNMLKPLKHL